MFAAFEFRSNFLAGSSNHVSSNRFSCLSRIVSSHLARLSHSLDKRCKDVAASRPEMSASPSPQLDVFDLFLARELPVLLRGARDIFF